MSIFNNISSIPFVLCSPTRNPVPGQYNNDDRAAAGGKRLRGPIFEGVYFTSRYRAYDTKYRLRNINQILPETSIVFEGVWGDIFG